MTDQPIKRSRKRVIKRDQLPANKLATTKKPPAKPKPKHKPAPAHKAPATPPSETRLQNLHTSLCGVSEVWREYKPLAAGIIEKQIFQHISRHSLSASKRVVKKMLIQHTRNPRYLLAIKMGDSRYNLDGTGADAIDQAEKEYVARILASKA